MYIYIYIYPARMMAGSLFPTAEERLLKGREARDNTNIMIMIMMMIVLVITMINNKHNQMIIAILIRMIVISSN